MRSPGSTKTRLTLYFTGLFGAIVVCLAVASYLLVTRAEYSDLDSGLHVAVVATAMSAQHELAEHSEKSDGEADLRSIMEESSSDALPGTQILIRENERTVAYKGTSNGGASLRNTASSRLLRNANIDGLRVASQQLEIPNFHTTYQIYAASAITPVVAKLSFFRRMLFVCVPLGLALAAFAGYLLARRALAPLNELTRTIDTVTSSDLSARVRIAAQDGDLGRLASRFNSLLDRLEAAFHMQRQFMADASHQLRTPLTVALSTAQVTARDGKRTVADCDESLGLVETQLLRLRRIIDNMLFLSQADATSLRFERREFYLDDAVSEAVRAANVLARPKGQTVRMENLLEARCLGDEELVKQAVLILLDNAVKYTPEGGYVCISLRQADAFWSCRVSNNGPAIAPESATRIFERFYRGQMAHGPEVPGEGLGLAIAKTIAETHGGELRLVSSDTGLTIFELNIPAHMPVEQSADQAKFFAVRM